MMRGDFRRLDKLIHRFDRLAGGKTVDRLARALGEQGLRLVDEGFARGRSPQGRRWPRPAYRTGPPMILSGRLRRSFVLRMRRPHGFEIISRAPYAAPLQRFGRHMVPDPAEITARWDRALRRFAGAWLEDQL